MFGYPTCLQNDDTNITNPITVSNFFNNYFKSIADNILAQRKCQSRISYKDFLANHLTENFVYTDTDEKEITSRLFMHQNLLAQTVSLLFLPHLLEIHISLPLSHIFNLPLRTVCDPDILKISKTIPVSNYRPISLLSNINKILEKIVYP